MYALAKKELVTARLQGRPRRSWQISLFLINQYYSATAKTAPQLLPSIRKCFEKMTALGSPMWELDESIEVIFVGIR